MCGIFGLFSYNNTEKSIDPIVEVLIQRFLLLETLVAMEPRGADATGVALLWEDKKTLIVKQPVASSFFARDPSSWGDEYINPTDKETNFSWFMDMWFRKIGEKRIKQILGHVRKSTKGDPHNPHNNHPVIITSKNLDKENKRLTQDTIVGVHNGSISNDDALFAKHGIERIGKVDSEIIFQLIAEYKNNFTIENLKTTHNELIGEFAVMSYTTGNPSKVGCLREGQKPMEGAYIPELGCLVMVSERKYLVAAMENYDRWRNREYKTSMIVNTKEGTKIELGNVGEVFPYLSKTWYGKTVSSPSSIESGVFILDLDTEVNSKTIPEDLIKVEKIYSCARGTPQTITKYDNGVKTNATKDTRAATEKFSTSFPSETNASYPSGNNTIEDKSKDEEGSLLEITLPGICADNEDVYEDIEIETEIVEDDPSCSYSWDERIAFGLECLHSVAIETEGKATIAKIGEVDVKELLKSWLVDIEDETEALKILVACYEKIFPEGYAYGYSAGYEQGTSEYETVSADEALEEKKKVEDLKIKVVSMEKTFFKNTEDRISLNIKLESATKLVRNLRLVLSALLSKQNLFAETGQIDENKLADVLDIDEISAAKELNLSVFKTPTNKTMN